MKAWQPDDATRMELSVETSRYNSNPYETFGGELQRIVLLHTPAPGLYYLIADEITAMLNPIVQVEIWQCLMGRARTGLGILAINHDRVLLERIATRIVTL
jgi:ABC-type dipeptide/oligopeptide/nickel transport system ATPase subunit